MSSRDGGDKAIDKNNRSAVKTRFRSRLAAAFICIALLATSAPAFAVPATPAAPTASAPPATPVANTSTLADKQREAQSVENEISLLDQQLEIVVEQYNWAHQALTDAQAKLKTTNADLESAEARYYAQKDIFDLRLDALYRNRDSSTLAIILNSSGITDLIKRVTFLRKMADRDASILSQVRLERDQVEQVKMNLQVLKSQQQQLEKELIAKRKDIQAQVVRRQRYLATVNADIQELLRTEEAKRKAEQSRLLASILSNTNSMGITAKPGSVVYDALKLLGVPYVWGGATPRGFDCSGLTMYVFARHGVKLPHYSGSQARMGSPVAPNDMRPADLVFFGNPIHHVGIYIGGGYFVHAPRTGDVVKISKLSEAHYSANFAWARRFPVHKPY